MASTRIEKVQTLDADALFVDPKVTRLKVDDIDGDQITWRPPGCNPFKLTCRELLNADGEPIADKHVFDAITFYRETNRFAFLVENEPEDKRYEYDMRNISFDLALVEPKKRKESSSSSSSENETDEPEAKKPKVVDEVD